VPVVNPRLDLDEEIVAQAKKTAARLAGADPETTDLETVYFSETAQLALTRHESTILRCLDQAGLRKQKTTRGRPRRLPEELWQHLGELSEEYDVSRIGLLRAALALLASETDPQAADAPSQ
jgi:hypothetical protein